ncbi:DUF3795 domain-containing protein [Marispirochaeta sp.]|uniref:DUF3795 domain-containing protein n=1 Tax=Marispirochaeta sp. TaxID=2038653 RepID=UPI0029C9AE54|nr:DUF3795 domain-containing protein [Marispirochaeta sp.]
MELNKVAPCGIDCINCELFAENKRPDVWERVAKMTEKSMEEVQCKGCREQEGCPILEDCQTLACVKENGVDFCYQCTEFPCRRLQPMKQGAERTPHNLKVYNLCRLKQLGMEGFLAESARTRRFYFEGTFVIGAGPTLPD